MDLSTIKNTGNWGSSASRLNDNFSKVGTEVDKLKYAAYNSKLYASEALLKQAIPSPSVGDWAIVGNAIPGEIYRCDTDGEWTATGQTGGGYGMEVTEKHVTEQYVTEVYNEYTGDIVNNPDDEDLISEEKPEGSKVLKLADKAYNAATFSGLGRVYLRKNISGSKNLLTQAMVAGMANTRFIVQYDYDLNEKTLDIPEGCILDFQGGSFSNGAVNGNNTVIAASEKTIFKDIVLGGTFQNDTFQSSWFGVVSGCDCTSQLQDAITNTNNTSVKKLLLNNGTYLISGTLYIPSRFSFGGMSKNALAAWTYTGEIPSIYQTANLPAIRLSSDNSECRNIDLHDLAIRVSEGYNETIGTLYGIYCPNCTNFTSNSFKNVWVEGFKRGLYIGLVQYGGVMKCDFSNMSFSKNVVGIHVHGDKDSQNRIPWFNDNWLHYCYFHSNLNGGFLIDGIDSVQSLVFQNCNFENQGLDYNEAGYSEVGCFAFKSSAGYGITNFNNCYFENNYARSGGSTASPSGFSYSKESSIILTKGGTINIKNCVLGRTHQLISILSHASVVLEDNDYYITGAINSNTSKSIVRYSDISNPEYINLVVRELRFSGNSYLDKVYEFGFAALSSTKSFFQSNVNIEHPNWGVEKYSNKQYADASVFYINANLGSKDYLGLSKSHPYKSLSDFLYYGVSRYDNIRSLTLIMETDITIPQDTFNNIKTVTNKDIVIDGHGNNLLFPASTYLTFDNCNITIKNANVAVDNTVGFINFIRLLGKSSITFVNCAITFQTSNGAYLVDSGDNSNVYCKFIDCAIDCRGASAANIYLTRKRENVRIMVSMTNVTNPKKIDYVSDTHISESVLTYLDNTNKTLTYASFMNSWVWGDSEGNVRNIDGTLLDKVSIVKGKVSFNKPKIYRIIGDVDLEGNTVTVVNNCTIDFQGGKIINGTIVLTNTRILPSGCNISEYISANIQGSYKEGQVLYDPALKKQKLWNGSFWTTLDGVILD